MRKIKFRAWDGQQMSYGKEERFDDMIAWRFHHFNDDNIILMQYTGLKDKNGKEIYEGDIVNFSNGNMMGTFNANSEVKFLDGCFMIEINDGWDEWDELWHYTKHWDVEVIGNIYENPHLLGKNE